MPMIHFEISIINLKIHISETNGPIELKFYMLSIFKSRICSIIIIKFWVLIWQYQNLNSTSVVQWLSYSPLDPRFAGSIPAWVDGFFQSVKILSMTSFGREVKPWAPCRRFTTRKRTSGRN